MGETKSFAGGSVGRERVGAAADAPGVGEVPAWPAGASGVPTAAGWRAELHPTITIAASRTGARLVMAASVPTCGGSGANLGHRRAYTRLKFGAWGIRIRSEERRVGKEWRSRWSRYR